MNNLRLSYLLRHETFSDTRLRLIAIRNLKDPRRSLDRWWHKKYKIPPKPFEDYLEEELYVEMLEDYYSANPAEVDRFLSEIGSDADEWDGTMPDWYEKQIQERLKKINAKNKVDIKKYQTDVKLSAEEEETMMANLGRDLPLSKVVKKQKDDDGFVDDFESEVLGG